MPVRQSGGGLAAELGSSITLERSTAFSCRAVSVCTWPGQLSILTAHTLFLLSEQVAFLVGAIAPLVGAMYFSATSLASGQWPYSNWLLRFPVFASKKF
eukprot:3437448-Pleurochrysis_carterae.AAC.1